MQDADVPPADMPDRTCKVCEKTTAVNGHGLCGDCQATFDNMQSDLAKPEVTLDQLLAKIKQADDLDGIVAALTGARPPYGGMEAQVAREKILAALKNHRADVSSPAKIVDAWLGTSKDDDDPNISAAQAAVLVKLVQDRGAVLFHTADHKGYVGMFVEGHREVLSLRSRQFRLWLSRTYWQHTLNEAEAGPEGKDFLSAMAAIAKGPSVPGAQALSDAIATLEGMAIFDGDEFEVCVRVGHSGNKTYLDLGDEKWSAVEIDATGWRVVATPPVMFRRPNGLVALPHPEPGTIEALRPFLNLKDRDWPLVIGYAVGLFSPGPYPVLVFLGEQGTAKSTSTKVVRRIADPNAAALRRKPRNDHDLAIAADNGWVITVDNISSMPVWLSDTICMLATGGGFATRQLYSDSDEQLFDSMRPVILNGIGAIAVRSDLLDRSLLIELEVIEEKIDEATFWADYEKALPGILGAVLDAVSAAIGNVSDVVLPQTPRMVDFARFVTAAEPALGLAPGSFLAAYLKNRKMADETALDAVSVSRFVRELVEHEEWNGTATQLLSRLVELANKSDNPFDPMRQGSTIRQDDWPGSASALSSQLKLIAPNLRRIGVEVTFGRAKDSRHISIDMPSRRVRKSSSSSSSSSSDPAGDGDDGDDDVLQTLPEAPADTGSGEETP